MYLNEYPAQYINYMTSDSEFIAFINHAIQLALDLTLSIRQHTLSAYVWYFVIYTHFAIT